MDNQLVLGPVRFCYINVFKMVESLSGKMQYSTTAMIPKSNKALVKRANDAIKIGIEKGVKSNKITKAQVGKLALPIRDGDDTDDRGNRGNEFNGMYYFSATNSLNRPGVVGSDKEPIIDEEEVYSGMWGNIHITFHAYNTNGNIGIRANLNHVMKTKDDDRLDGRKSVDEAFEEIEAEGSEME